MTCPRCNDLERELAALRREKRTLVNAISTLMRTYVRIAPDRAKEAADKLFRRQN